MKVKIVHGQPGCLVVYTRDRIHDVCYGSDGIYVIYYDTFDFFSYRDVMDIIISYRSEDDEELS